MTKTKGKTQTKAQAKSAFKYRRIPKTWDEWKIWTRRNGGKLILSIFRYALILCIGMIILMPLLEMISGTLMSPDEVGSPVSKWVPASFSKEHIYVAFKMLNYPKALLYTIGTTALQVLLQILSAAVTGYSFARLRSKRFQKLFAIVILTIVVPPSVLMLPQYLFFRSFDIFGIIEAITGSPLNMLGKPIVVYILDFFGMGLKAGLYIFIFRQFFRGLPRELEEAAHMDGCSFLRTLFSIIMPNAVPGIITVGVLSFVWNWNDTYYTNLFVSNKLNLMVKLLDVSGDPENTIAAIGSKIPASFVFNTKSTLYQGSILTAGSLLVILPLIVMYMFVQKRFVESASNAGIVG
jgi:multiple sugar transport system permease protein